LRETRGRAWCSTTTPATKEKINANLAVREHGGVVALEEAVHQRRDALVEHGRRRRACAAVHMVEGEGVAADLDLHDGNKTEVSAKWWSNLTPV